MDFNGSGSLEMRYLNGPAGDIVDTVLARQSASGTVAWYLPDRLGTIRDLINNSGSIIDHVDYSAFGTVLDESSPSNGDRMMGFAGMERDTVTGMNLAVHRVEGTANGRWISQVLIGFAGGETNLYQYAGNGPTTMWTRKGWMMRDYCNRHGIGDQVSLHQERRNCLEWHLKLAKAIRVCAEVYHESSLECGDDLSRLVLRVQNMNSLRDGLP